MQEEIAAALAGGTGAPHHRRKAGRRDRRRLRLSYPPVQQHIRGSACRIIRNQGPAPGSGVHRISRNAECPGRNPICYRSRERLLDPAVPVRLDFFQRPPKLASSTGLSPSAPSRPSLPDILNCLDDPVCRGYSAEPGGDRRDLAHQAQALFTGACGSFEHPCP